MVLTIHKASYFVTVGSCKQSATQARSPKKLVYLEIGVLRLQQRDDIWDKPRVDDRLSILNFS